MQDYGAAEDVFRGGLKNTKVVVCQTLVFVTADFAVSARSGVEVADFERYALCSGRIRRMVKRFNFV
jgi:hypothetical protein